MRTSLGREFGWLWASFAVSSLGSRLAIQAFPLVALLVLDAGTAQVSVLAAAGLAAGAVLGIPLGPWVEFRRKRSVLIGADLLRCTALLSVPAAYALGWLGFTQLLVVSMVTAVADIAARSASGAWLKQLVRREDLVHATGRLEATTWTTTTLGPPLGGLAIAAFGPMATLVADAVSYLLSAAGIRAAGGRERPPERAATSRSGELLAGWRHIWHHPGLKLLLGNTILTNGLIMATAPLALVLMVRELGFTLWEYGLAFALPCLGGLLGARLAPRLVTRFGTARVLRVAGVARVCWPVGLVLVGPGLPGLLLVIAVQFGLVTCMGVFNPVFAAYRLAEVPTDRSARVLAAWTVSGNLTVAGLTALWGVLAGFTGARVAIGIAGVLILATPLLLPRAERVTVCCRPPSGSCSSRSPR
ncbi:MFS transporter [Crossiella cryophila]|uniref:MFS-type transporter involved in bile tolerance (Atg22 family) n=1 Tax=Crossiella cryophila TaxID=43355 RepID=A0A7W7CIE7_9PSEU|nr:MFS transporter [Crossiella cryophila]MBB4680326.1 MFS-type transporter involved in bile tolerance (Atg22 family) [Crossiella cryophila]